MPWVLFARRWLPITALVLAGGAVCARLGVWQIDRLAQRRASNARIAHVTSLPPVVLPTSEDLGSQEYRGVSVQGVYDFSNQVALRNQARGAEYGYHLLTPLLLADNDDAHSMHAVLVDRGWIPAAGNATPEDWRKYDSPGVVLVEGVIRLGRAGAPSQADRIASTASNPSAGRFALTVDSQRIAAQAGYQMLPFYVQVTGSSDPAELPAAEALTLDVGDGPHLGYAIQWFGFALALLFGYAFYVHRQEARGV